MARKVKRPKFAYFGPYPCGCRGYEYMTREDLRNMAADSKWREKVKR